MSNLLLNQSVGEKVQHQVTEANPSFWRAFMIDAIALLSALLLGYLYQLFVSGQPIIYSSAVPSFWTILVVLSVFSLASLFQLALIKDGGRRIGIQVVQVLCLGFFLYDESVRWLITESIAVLIVLLGSWRARNELSNMLNVSFFRVAYLYYARLILALGLLATIFYFPYWEQHKTILPQSAFDNVVSWSLGFTSSFYPDIHLTPSSTFNEVVSSLATAQMAGTPGVDKLPSSEQQRLSDRAQKVIAEQLRNWLGSSNPGPDESLSSFLYRYMQQGLQHLEDQFSQWFFIGWLIAALLFFLSVGRIYSLIMSAAAFVIFQILLASRFVNFYVTTVSKETLDF